MAAWTRALTPQSRLPSALLLSCAWAERHWYPSDITQARRLDIDIASSHTNRNDTACIVGGYDTDNPTKVYVGGPCKSLKEVGDEIQMTDDFRWMEMETVYIQIEDKDGNAAPFKRDDGASHVNPKEEDSHAEIGVLTVQDLDVTGMKRAALFASTTSYLSKKNFEFNTNTFLIDHDSATKKDTFVDICVSACCDEPGDAGCDCASGCPTTKIKAVPGSFKYSILAAAFDHGDATAGASGNGWLKVVDTYGEGSPKAIKGAFIGVYQVLDFTNMKGDTLTVTAANKTSTSSFQKTVRCTRI
eukprot:TRINITY_DN6949_c0_g1_i3.p1 TRINITY_DN6949_c0_g1~~TRINITY_DN6949_c0_g1_i3.p1  ORF type:complete len:326 (+),score=60.83 TRINITY_DN6949_c0_g1_i3:76-978(+)